MINRNLLKNSATLVLKNILGYLNIILKSINDFNNLLFRLKAYFALNPIQGKL